jgi:TolA-binding protein
MTIVECEFKRVGCTAKLSRKDMINHMKYSIAGHESLKMMTKVKNQLKDNTREIKELETKLHQKQKNLIKEQKDLFDKM